MKKPLLQFSLIGILLVADAYAYIDPGTAGTIIGGSVWPFLVMIGTAIAGFFVKIFINPIKRFFRGIRETLSRKK